MGEQIRRSKWMFGEGEGEVSEGEASGGEGSLTMQYGSE